MSTRRISKKQYGILAWLPSSSVPFGTDRSSYDRELPRSWREDVEDLYGNKIPESYYPWEFARRWLDAQGITDPLSDVEMESCWLGEPLHQKVLDL